MSLDPIVVAFTGHKFHGKDTAARVLTKHYDFEQIAFADGLRKTVATALRVNPSYFLDPEKKEEIDPRTGKARRYWLQYIGTEGFRALWDDIWVWWATEEIKSCGHDRIVITDMRFPNEIEALKREFKNLLTIRIVNPRITASGDTHASEIHIADLPVDLEIANDTTITALHAKVERALIHRFDIQPRSSLMQDYI